MILKTFQLHISGDHFPGYKVTQPFFINVEYEVKDGRFNGVRHITIPFSAVGTLYNSEKLKREIEAAALNNFKMHREIKFRAWDKDHNKMLNNIHEIWRLDMVTDFNSNESEHNDLRLGWMNEGKFGYWRDIIPKQIILMQFTGLKDKTGKEIYEGDLLRYEYYHPTIGKQTFINEVVFYQGNGRYAIEYMDGEYHYFGETVFQNACEVIGNVYETAEAINQK